MLYVVVREIEGGKRQQSAVFATSTAAMVRYERARLVCDNDPDEFGDGDPSIVSRCWLYAADATDQVTARAMTRDGRAVLVASYSEADFHDAEIP